ncbi:MAG: DUF4832 domain-containing protein [Leadbetterella sp.]
MNRKVFSLLIAILCFTCKNQAQSDNLNPNDLSKELLSLESNWDYNRVLSNPDKGWYHHFYDNGNNRYMDKGDDKQISNFPNLHHLYLRLPWSYLEPKEGQFNWSWIDDLVNKWYDKQGIKISICITAKETDLQYATPKWVRDAGAKGLDIVPKAEYASWIINTWEPDYGDPIFLQKLDNFHKACASRYDGKPYIVDIVTGSIGSWGEGHHSYSSDKNYPLEVYKKHFDIYSKYYTKSQLTTGDDWIKWHRTPEQIEELRSYAKARGFSYRDDSVLVDYWLKFLPLNQASIAAAYLFDDAYLKYPTTIEMEHYFLQRENKNWDIPNGLPKGQNEILQAIKLTHATYISFHGYIDEWLRENPNVVHTIANRVGYWYFPQSIEAQTTANTGDLLTVKVNWKNEGAAPAYNKYDVFVRLINASNSTQKIEIAQSESDNRKWEPGKEFLESYQVKIPNDFPKGQYKIQIALKTKEKTPRLIDLGLNSRLKLEDGYFDLKELEIK